MGYFSPDGGFHQDGTDGSHIRITPVGNPVYQYTVEFPDGSKHTFAHSFDPPHPVSGSSSDFTELGWQETGPQRFGLTQIQDSFGNVVLTVSYDGAYPWEVATITLPTLGQTISVTWESYTVNSAPPTPPVWRIVEHIDFPVFGSTTTRRVTFGYQDATFPRNAYDNSGPPAECANASTNVAVPSLSSITFSDTNSSFSYAYTMAYYAQPSTPPQQQGALQTISLPTGGNVSYTYGWTSGGTCQVPPCDPDASVPAGPLAPPTPGGRSWEWQRFLDKSIAVVTRCQSTSATPCTSTDPTTTTYTREQIIVSCPQLCNGSYDWDPFRIARRVDVVAPGNDSGTPTQYLTRYFFHVAGWVDFGDVTYRDGGIELERRYYKDATTTTAVRDIISCWVSGVCGYHTSAGTTTLQKYDFTTLPPKQAEVTWYGAVPSGSDGGTCPTGTTPCTAASNSDYDTVAQQYKTTTVTSNLAAMSGWTSRVTKTIWAACVDSSHWNLGLFTSKSVTDTGGVPPPTSVSTSYSFNCNGFLNNYSTTDATYGSVSHTFTADTVWNPKKEDVAGTGQVSTTTFTNTRAFQTFLPLTNQRTGISWKSFDVDRDASMGLIKTSRDPNSALATTYTYDALGRLKTITPPGGELATTISYDSTTQTTVSRGSGSSGTWQRYIYDGLGRLSREIRQMPSAYSVRRHAYDSAGHANFVSEWASCTNATGDCLTAPTTLGTTSSNFDPFGRAQHSQRADGQTTDIDFTDIVAGVTIQFSDTRQKVTINNVNGSPSATTTQTDPLGRVISVTEPGGDLTIYTYNALDKLVCVRQGGTPDMTNCTNKPGGQYRLFIYDSFGFLRKEITPEKGTVDSTGSASSPSYDSLGNVLTRTEASGTSGSKQHNYTYDSAGRLLTETVGTSSPVSYLTNCYDGSGGCYSGGTYPKGKLTRQIATNPLFKPLYPTAATSETVRLDLDYSGLGGRPSSKIAYLPTGATDGAVERWSYNDLGLVNYHLHPRAASGFNVTGGILLFDEQLTYTYGLPTQIQLVSGSLEYDESQVPQATFTATYWPSGGLGSYTASQTGGATITTTITQDSSLLPRPSRISSSLGGFDTGSYAYDGVGNILTMTNGSNVDTFKYDARSRLISAKYAGQTTTCTDSAGNTSRNQCFAYDRYGNLTGVTGTNPRTLTTSTTTNHLSSGAYDYRGNLTSYSPDTLTFDDLNRQVENVNTSSGDWQYLYDGGNERTVRTTTASGGSLVPRREIARYIVQAKGWTTTTACNEGSRQFVDVHCADTDWKFIQAFFEHGIDSGCGGPNLYCPETSVTRDTLAVILLKAEHGSSYAPPLCAGIFTDVPCTNQYAKWIEQVYREGIVPACALPPALAYCPTGTVTETKMLTYLANSALFPTYHPIAGGSTYTFRDQQNRVVTEFYGPFAARDNIFLGNVLVASYVDKQPGITGNWQFHVSDHLGSLRLSVKGSDGSQVEAHKYWPYGDEVAGGTSGQRLTFAAMERDTEASHFYDHARSHDFNLGRFLSPDILQGNTAQPWAWNRYAYSANNPLKNKDPDGKIVEIATQSPPDARELFFREASAAAGIQVYEDSSGRVQRAEGPPAPGHQEALQAVDTAIAQPETIRLRLSSRQPFVFVDDFTFQVIVPSDLALFPTSAPSTDPEATTQGELVTHIFTEYSWAAAHGGFTGGNFGGAHTLGLDAQSQYRLTNGQSAVATVTFFNNSSGEIIAYRACYASGSCKIMFAPR